MLYMQTLLQTPELHLTPTGGVYPARAGVSFSHQTHFLLQTQTKTPLSTTLGCRKRLRPTMYKNGGLSFSSMFTCIFICMCGVFWPASRYDLTLNLVPSLSFYLWLPTSNEVELIRTEPCLDCQCWILIISINTHQYNNGPVEVRNQQSKNDSPINCDCCFQCLY